MTTFNATMLSANDPDPSDLLIGLGGALLLAGYFVWGLFGVVTIQVYRYYQSFSNDKAFIKALVYTTYILQAAQLVLITRNQYSNQFSFVALEHGKLEMVNNIGTDWLSGCLLTGIVAFAIQSFYAWRIHVISNKKGPPIIVITISCISFISSIISAVNIKTLGQYSKLGVGLSVTIKTAIWQGSAAVCDVLIAGCMVYYLRRHLSEGETHKKTEEVVNRLICLSIETGSFTACASILSLILSIGSGRTPYFICPTAASIGLYNGSLMALLNSRLKTTTITSHSITWKDSKLAKDHSFQAVVGHNTLSISGDNTATMGSVVQDAELAERTKDRETGSL